MDTKWYVIRTVTGKEKKAVEQLESEFKKPEYEGRINQVLIPMEKVYMTRKGKKYITKRNYYPGYVLIEADPNIIGEIKNLNKRVNNVIEFLGGDTPISLRPDEVDRILGKMDELSMSDETLLDKYLVGEQVKIIDGPFSGFIGNVDDVNEDRKKVKLAVNIFGRKTPLELNYTQITKNE
jgi:transcriptional antiterminator NusG